MSINSYPQHFFSRGKKRNCISKINLLFLISSLPVLYSPIPSIKNWFWEIQLYLRNPSPLSHLLSSCPLLSSVLLSSPLFSSPLLSSPLLSSNPEEMWGEENTEEMPGEEETGEENRGQERTGREEMRKRRLEMDFWDTIGFLRYNFQWATIWDTIG